MCGRNDTIGCISVVASVIGSGLNVMGKVASEHVSVVASVIGSGLNVMGAPVCGINASKYLNVSPEYLWLSPDMLSSGDFEIVANVEWYIV